MMERFRIAMFTACVLGIGVSELPAQPKQTRRKRNPVRVRFHNAAKMKLRAVWVDSRGREHDYGPVAVDQEYTQPSAPGHLWRFKNDGDVIAHFVVGRNAKQQFHIRRTKSAAKSPETEVIRLVNQIRARYGLRRLAHDEQLSAAARGHSQYMSRYRRFSHYEGRRGRSRFWQRANSAGTSAHSENIAMTGGGARAVVNMWMRSPGHRRNILSRRSTTIGVGKAGRYWTQMFGNGVAR